MNDIIKFMMENWNLLIIGVAAVISFDTFSSWVDEGLE